MVFAVAGLTRPFAGDNVDAVAGIEARGFIFGALVARELAVPFVPIRKAGKLPYRTLSASYALEYGVDTLEMHTDAIARGARVLVVDDLIATGGTAEATCELIEGVGGEVAGCCFVIELDGLDGRKRLAGRRVHSLLRL